METQHFFTYRFEDGSDNPLIPADDGAWSLEGFAHAATLTTHFFVEGKIRRRAPYSDKFRLFIGPPRRGSWLAEFFLAMEHPDIWAGAAAGGIVAGAPTVFKVFKRLADRATGVNPTNDGSEAFEERHPGTFDALVEAVEPSLVRAHRVVTSSKTTVSAEAGPVRFTFNRETKAYIEHNDIDTSPVRLRGNVASYNVNSRTGRIFFDELGRTVPFTLMRNADARSEIALARSLQAYAEHRLSNSDIDITFKARRAADGRIKSMLISDADFIMGVRR